jgi:hypothetical protein
MLRRRLIFSLSMAKELITRISKSVVFSNRWAASEKERDSSGCIA